MHSKLSILKQLRMHIYWQLMHYIIIVILSVAEIKGIILNTRGPSPCSSKLAKPQVCYAKPGFLRKPC